MTKATRCSKAAAFLVILATFGLASLMIGSMPAMADADGCRGDQACLKIFQATGCHANCQQQCKELRFDAAGCYATWGPKFQFWASQRSAPKRATNSGTK